MDAVYAVARFRLDPGTAHDDVLFSNDNLTATSSSFDQRVVLGTLGFTRGVHYWQFNIDRYENNKDPAFGVATLHVPRDRMIGEWKHRQKYRHALPTPAGTRPTSAS